MAALRAGLMPALAVLSLASASLSSASLAQPVLDPPRFRGEELTNAVQQASAAAGFPTCSAALAKVALFLSNGMDATYTVEPLGVDETAWPIVLTMESENPGGGDRLSVANMNPGCSGMYTQTIYWSRSCEAVKTQVFPNFGSQKTFMRNVRKSRSGRNLELFLMPAAAGCVSIKKELFRF